MLQASATVAVRKTSHWSGTPQVDDPGPTVGGDQVEIDPRAVLEVGGGKRCDMSLIQSTRSERGTMTSRVGKIDGPTRRESLDHGELLGIEPAASCSITRSPGDLEGSAVTTIPPCSTPYRCADAGCRPPVWGRFQDSSSAGRDDLAGGGEVRTRHMGDQVRQGRVRVIQQVDAGGRHLPQVVRRYVRGHADRDASGTVQQQVGNRAGNSSGSSMVPSKLGSHSTVPWSSSSRAATPRRA